MSVQVIDVPLAAIMHLSQTPGTCFVHPQGNVIYVSRSVQMSDSETQQVVGVCAIVGSGFNNLNDEQLNQLIIETFGPPPEVEVHQN